MNHACALGRGVVTFVIAATALADRGLAQGPEYNRYVSAGEIFYEPVPGGTGWQISAVIGFESIPGDSHDLSCTVDVLLNGAVLPGGGSGGGIFRIFIGLGGQLPGGGGITCAEFCILQCFNGTACGPIDGAQCMCVTGDHGQVPYGPGFRIIVPASMLVEGDVISVRVAAAPIPEALPEIDVTDDFASVVVALPPPCAADWNDSGAVTSADITAFLGDWFADLSGGTNVADFNESGATTSADITAFLGAWFEALANGC
ncbi:MAG: hypothetical protein H7Y88_09240 [Phycisphaerales bacterium]|nr:hypothetical protein [Phycisphaerales bacterium]